MQKDSFPSVRWRVAAMAALGLTLVTASGARAAVVPFSFTDRSEIEGFTTTLSQQQVENFCGPGVIPAQIICNSIPTSASFNGPVNTASASTDGRGGSSLQIDVFNHNERSIAARTRETGFYRSNGAGRASWNAFLPNVNFNALFLGPGIDMRFSLSVSVDSVVPGVTPFRRHVETYGFLLQLRSLHDGAGNFDVADPDGNPYDILFSFSGQGGAESLETAFLNGLTVDPGGFVTLSVENLLVAFDLAFVDNPTISLSKSIQFENHNSFSIDSNLEFATLDVVDPFTVTGDEHLLLNAFTFTDGGVVAAPEPATLALFGLGLAGLGLARRRRG